ncbi:hypothetical protein ENUP19_0067G0014 [Entamoeba nuttalli]|uniref:WD domain, G-beta repeat-containing protein n=1 Tax=Entamoeba nuttalli TaxID=412467 RepID=A0ABQ0DEH9_9EUKA
MINNQNEMIYFEENDITSVSINKRKDCSLQIGYTTYSDKITTHVHILNHLSMANSLVPIEINTNKKNLLPASDIQFLPFWFKKDSVVCAGETLEISYLNEKAGDLIPTLVDGFSLYINSDYPTIGVEPFKGQTPQLLSWRLNGELSLWNLGQKNQIMTTKQFEMINDVSTSYEDETSFVVSCNTGIYLYDTRCNSAKKISNRIGCSVSYSFTDPSKIAIGTETLLHVIDCRMESQKIMEFITKTDINELCWYLPQIAIATNSGVVLWNPTKSNSYSEYTSEYPILNIDCGIYNKEWCVATTDHSLLLLNVYK